MSTPEYRFHKPKKAKKQKDPHPNDRFTQWKRDEFVNEVRIRAKAAGIEATAPTIRALVAVVIEVLKDTAMKGIVVNFYGFMRWGPKSYRACTFVRNGVEIQKRASTVPFVKFSPTYRQRVKEAHKDYTES